MAAFNLDACPSRIIEKFESGKNPFEDAERSGAPKAARTDENIEKIREIIESDPTASVRRISQSLRVSVGTVHRILHEDLAMFPYKIQIGQPISSGSLVTSLTEEITEFGARKSRRL